MNFEPVHLPAELHPTSLSVTLLGRQNVCPRSALLALLHQGGAGAHELIRGTAVHTAIERSILRAMIEGERRIPPDVAREEALNVIEQGVLLGRETDPHPGRVAVPFEEQDMVRMCVFRFAELFEFDPADVRGVEQMFVLEVGGWTVRGKLDLARAVDGVLVIDDWKSSRAMPSYDEVSIRQSDGRLSPKTFPLIVYGLMARYGHPVEWVVCGACDGPVTDPHAQGCEACEGRGGAWRKLPKWPVFPRYELNLIYPAIDVGDQLAVRGPLVLEERDLFDFGRALAGQVEMFGDRLKTGDWPALPSSHACGQCVATLECPLPPTLRDWKGEFKDLDHAERVAGALYVAKKNNEKVHAALRQAAADNGWDLIRCGTDRAYSFAPKVSHIGEARERRESTEFRDRAYVPESEERSA